MWLFVYKKFNLQNVSYIIHVAMCRYIKLFSNFPLYLVPDMNLIIDILNSSPPSAAYMRQWIRSALVQIIACAYSAPSHYLNKHCVIVSWTLGTNFSEIHNFILPKMHLKISCAKWPPFFHGVEVGWVKWMTSKESLVSGNAEQSRYNRN